jgi:hypothetical protein
MAPHNEEDDPAIYRSGSHKKAKPTVDAHAESSSSAASRQKQDGSPAEELEVDGNVVEEDQETAPESDAMDEDEEDDSTLLAVQPGFNRLLLVLRDERVMRFVKYVSAAAEGSRWDICGEYEVGMVEEADASDGDSQS